MISKTVVAAALLFAVLHLPSICEAQAFQWQVNKTEEIIFGQTGMELVCSGTTCCTGSPREWIGGPSSITLITNGVPTDSAKYEETLQTNSFSLVIKTLELTDVNVQYQCVINFASSLSTVLLPTEDVFRYVPDVNSEIEIVKNFTGSNIYLTANLTRVFPEPVCTAYFEERNITSSMVLTTSDNVPIKYTVIEMNGIPYQCNNSKGSFVISCYVGTIPFTVVQENLCKIPTIIEKMTTDSSNEPTTISHLPYMSFSYSIDKTLDKTTKNLLSSIAVHKTFAITTDATSETSESDHGDPHIHLKTIIFTYSFCGIIFFLSVGIIICIAIRGANKKSKESNTEMGITDSKHLYIMNCDSDQTNIRSDEQMGYDNLKSRTNVKGNQMNNKREGNYSNTEFSFYNGSNKPAIINETVEIEHVNSSHQYHEYDYDVHYHDVTGQTAPTNHLYRQASDLQGYSFYSGYKRNYQY